MQNTPQHGPGDHESDPAHNTEDGHEWVDEGGASHLGPATHLASGHPEPADGTDEDTDESEDA